MKTWSFTAGWRKNRGTALTVAALLLFTAGGLDAGGQPAPPDPEMLEFLGTFRTKRGSDVDPFMLREGPAPGKERKKGETVGKPEKRDKKKDKERKR